METRRVCDTLAISRRRTSLFTWAIRLLWKYFRSKGDWLGISAEADLRILRAELAGRDRQRKSRRTPRSWVPDAFCSKAYGLNAIRPDAYVFVINTYLSWPPAKDYK